jgi:hypothetical protein
MKRAALLATVWAISACQCTGSITGPGGSGQPCATTDECPAGEVCAEDGRCALPSAQEGDGGSGTDGGNGCVGLECQQQACTGGGSTVLTGKVYTPRGDLPLYGAIVYVPNGTVTSFTPGVSCDRCAAASGNPLVTTTTRPDGTFRLENVPAGEDIPLVIQLGRWRRQVTIPSVPACAETALTDVGLTRLPRNQGEGDIPQMAIATGRADPFECLLRKVGLDDAEFTPPDGSGRVHYYRARLGIDLDGGAPRADALWSDLQTLKQYDVVILPCEATDSNARDPSGSSNDDPTYPIKTQTAKQNLVDYTSAGGRVFATHFSYVWLDPARGGRFDPVATWTNREDPVTPYTNPFDVWADTTFQKGDAFADWLVHVGASSTKGALTLRETRHNVDAVLTPQAQRWLHGVNTRASDQPIVTHFTFNTPVSALGADAGAPDQCGRVVFSSFHVSANALHSGNTAPTTFPAICKDEPPSEQERALIFMLFDLSACVQRDDIPIIN